MTTTQRPLTDETRDLLVGHIAHGTIDCSSEEGRYDSLTEDDARRIVDSLWGPMTEAALAAVRNHESAALSAAPALGTHRWRECRFDDIEKGERVRWAFAQNEHGTFEMMEGVAHELQKRRGDRVWVDAGGDTVAGAPAHGTDGFRYWRLTEHERTTPADPHHDPRHWQDCTREDVREGDLVEGSPSDRLIIGVARHQNKYGNWSTEDGYLLTLATHWPLRRIPAPTPPAEEVELPTEFGAVITNARHGANPWASRLVYAGRAGWIDEAGDFWHPSDITAFTLPDGTRARRDGERENGEPRFVKVQEGEK